MHPENDLLWSWDIQKKLHQDLSPIFPKTKIMKAKVLKDIYLNQINGKYKFQLEFVEQDVVIFSHTMDMTEFMNLNKMNIENQDEDFRGRIVIPRILIKLAFNGLTGKEMAAQSKIAMDIKSIFPQCRTILLSLYKGNILEVDGKNSVSYFDKAVYFLPGKPGRNEIYRKGDFNARLDESVRQKYEGLTQYILSVLKSDNLSIMQ